MNEKERGLSNVSLSYSHLTEARNRIEKKFGSQNRLTYKMAIDWQEIADDVLYNVKDFLFYHEQIDQLHARYATLFS